MTKLKTPQLPGREFINQNSRNICNALIIKVLAQNSQALEQELPQNFSQLSDDELKTAANRLPVGEVDS